MQDNAFNRRVQEPPCTTIQAPRATDRTSLAADVAQRLPYSTVQPNVSNAPVAHQKKNTSAPCASGTGLFKQEHESEKSTAPCASGTGLFKQENVAELAQGPSHIRNGATRNQTHTAKEQRSKQNAEEDPGAHT